jgi:hypothetical protein
MNIWNWKGEEWPYSHCWIFWEFFQPNLLSFPHHFTFRKMLDYHLKQSKKFVKNQRANRNGQLGKKALMAFILVALAFLAVILF